MSRALSPESALSTLCGQPRAAVLCVQDFASNKTCRPTCRRGRGTEDAQPMTAAATTRPHTLTFGSSVALSSVVKVSPDCPNRLNFGDLWVTGCRLCTGLSTGFGDCGMQAKYLRVRSKLSFVRYGASYDTERSTRAASLLNTGLKSGLYRKSPFAGSRINTSGSIARPSEPVSIFPIPDLRLRNAETRYIYQQRASP